MRVTGRPRRPTLRIAPVLAASLVLAACGGDSDEPTSTGTSASSASTPASTGTTRATTTSAAGGGPVTERLAATAAALRTVKSYHVKGTQTDEDGPAEIEGDVTADGTAEFELSMKQQTVTFRVIGTTAYLRADADYWRENGGAQGDVLARELGGRWVKAPSGGLGVGELLEQLSPRTLAACLTIGNGTIRDGGTERVGDRDADVLIDAGDKPGTAPSRLFTAADGPPLPVRVLQTGKRRAGGKVDPKCGDENDTTTASDIQFSKFDEPVEVEAPKDAIEIPGGSDGTPEPSTT